MATNNTPGHRFPLVGALRGLALGRVALGVAALAAPRALTRTVGVGSGPELTYLTRIFGARAIALGLGYLTAPREELSRWQRLGLLVDVLDTAHGCAHVARGDVPRRAAVAMATLTGGYMLIGAARLVGDLQANCCGRGTATCGGGPRREAREGNSHAVVTDMGMAGPAVSRF
ncbi:hypothetical protein AB0B25_04145 [Nocardia sp. NPDC049190]|uniref:hypothetical protein n=1 Tax=Nocardia sp. NPDC049190 TaxID=3155650 RepID=UPI00340EEAC1